MTALPELRSVEIAGRTLAWRERGRGDPLVLVHGIGGYSASFANQFDAFSDKYRVIAWDAPGYGGSTSLPTQTPTAGDYAQALAGLLAALDVQSPHMVGHSLGAIFIAALYRSQLAKPRSVTFLQPVAGSGSLPAEEREKLRLSRISDMRALGAREFAVQRGRTILSPGASPAVVAEAVEVMAAVPEAGYLAAWETMCSSDLFALASADYPTLVICGSDDPVSPEKTCRAIASHIGQAELHRLNGVGHYASIEAPDRLNALLRGFLESPR